MSQGPGHVPWSDPADKGEAQADIRDCEGAYRDYSALFGHRGGAAGRAVWRRIELLWAQEPKGTPSAPKRSFMMRKCHFM